MKKCLFFLVVFPKKQLQIVNFSKGQNLGLVSSYNGPIMIVIHFHFWSYVVISTNSMY